MEMVKKLFARIIFTVLLPAAIIVACVYIFNFLANFMFLVATVCAFGVGSFAMYLVFKYWVSTDVDQESPQQQMMRYLIIFTINIGINTEIVYFLVTYAGVPLLA